MRIRNRLVLGVLTALAMIGAGGVSPSMATTQPSVMSYLVIPHPDDEWQQWALTETSPGNYQVFTLMTQGEASGHCSNYGGKGSQECKDKRLTSWLGFLTDMSAADPTIPGDWADPVSLGWATAWVDKQGRGAAVAFDFGDGNLTELEVVAAMTFITDPVNRAALGINSTLPNYNMIGSYYNGGYADCPIYSHPDHYAVHKALYRYDLGVAYQAAATCKTDGDAKRTQKVKDISLQAAWSGANATFLKNYGWLDPYMVDQTGPFFSTQSYWVRSW